MAPGIILLREALPLIEVPRVFHKITREWLGRTILATPEEIVQALILAVIVPLVPQLVQGVPSVLIRGPPAAVLAALAVIIGVSTGMTYVTPDHLLVQHLLGLTNLNHLSEKVFVFGAVAQVIKERSVGGIRGRYHPPVAIVSTCSTRRICAAFGNLVM